MSAFVWTMLILGMVEVSMALAYWTVGRVPERTLLGVAISAVIWGGFSGWAAYLLFWWQP
jgi:hypothetical protein